MTRLFRVIVVAFATISALAVLSASASATPPTYLILRAPTASHEHRPVYNPGYGYGVQTPRYSYGWFGAHPHPQWSRHFGFYRNYTEWSAR
jgi:hypothetical protein